MSRAPLSKAKAVHESWENFVICSLFAKFFLWYVSPSLRSMSTENILECLCRVLVLKKLKTLLKIHMQTTHLLMPSFTLCAFHACVRIRANVEIMQFWFQEKLTWFRMVALELLIWFCLERYWERCSPSFFFRHHTLRELWKALLPAEWTELLCACSPGHPPHHWQLSKSACYSQVFLSYEKCIKIPLTYAPDCWESFSGARLA